MDCTFYFKWLCMDKLPGDWFNSCCIGYRRIDDDKGEDGGHESKQAPNYKQMLEHFEETTDQVLYELSLRNMAAINLNQEED